MNDSQQVWISAIAGAVVGGLFGYLYLTEPGRRLRQDLEPRLAEIASEVQRARDAAIRAKDAADEGWAAVRRVEGSLRNTEPA